MLRISYYLLLIILLFGCKAGLKIGDKKMPFEKICGSQAEYQCEANGTGPIGLEVQRKYLKQRPSCAGKGEGFNYCNLGRTVDNKAWNNPQGVVIELREGEVTSDTALINYDFKSEKISKLLVQLDAALSKNKIPSAVSAEIKSEFRSALNKSATIEAQLITHTMSSDVIDGIRDAKNGFNSEARFVEAYNRLKNNGYHFVREVKVIKEICSYEENKDVTSILTTILEGKSEINDIKLNAIVNGTVDKKKTRKFTSFFELTTIYAYGYWNQHWMSK